MTSSNPQPAPTRSAPRIFDGFLIGMMLALLLAWLYPDAGRHGGWLRAQSVGRVGIALVFFLNGALLPFAELRRGVRAWRVHALVQSFTFGVFPLLGLACLTLLPDATSEVARTGLFFLCALPSTVTSAVALTSAAHGNVPLAVFNSTLSSVLGIVLTPLWLSMVMGTQGGAAELSRSIGPLTLLVLLPLVVGQLLRPWLGEWLSARRTYAKALDRGVILLLIYTAFCNSVHDGVWKQHGGGTLVLAVLGSALTFFAMFHAASAACRLLGLDEATRRAAVLCSSQKSLAVGVPMAGVLFGSSAAAGLILLPILVYHPLQLAVSGWVVGYWMRKDQN